MANVGPVVRGKGLTFLANLVLTKPRQTEVLCEVCKTVAKQCGRCCVSMPLVELGAALTKAKYLASGVSPRAVATMTTDACMPPCPDHFKGLVSFVREGTVEECKRLHDQTKVCVSLLCECAWSRELASMEENDATLLYGILLDASAVFQDLEKMLAVYAVDSDMRVKAG